MTTEPEAKTYPMNAISADALPSMFQAVAGLRNFRSAAAMLSCFALSVVVPGLLWTVLGKGFAAVALGALVAALLVASGIHAGGMLLMDQAKQVPMRSISKAIVLGMWCVPKSIVLVVGLLLAVIGVYLFMALLFFVCKIPGLGPLLYVIIFPVAVVVAGLTFTGLFMGMMISLAAMWEGSSVSGALVKALTALRTRLVETALLSFVVFALAGLVFFFAGGVLMTGFLPAVGMSASMLGASPQMFSSLGASLMGMGGDGGALGGYALAGSFGGGLLFALTMTLVFQVWLLGINLVYLKVTEGLDVSTTDEAIQFGLAEVRRNAAEMGSKAKKAAEQVREHASQAVEKSRKPRPQPLATAFVAPAAAVGAGDGHGTDALRGDSAQDLKPRPHCPACSSEFSPDDLFCGSCGHRLKH